MIHPDKATHPKAQDAFDLLKKVDYFYGKIIYSDCLHSIQAEGEVQDKDKRENLDAVVKQARIELLRAMNLPISTTDDHAKLKDLSPPWKRQLKDKTKAMLIDDELRRRRYVSDFLAPVSNCTDSIYQSSQAGNGQRRSRSSAEGGRSYHTKAQSRR